MGAALAARHRFAVSLALAWLLAGDDSAGLMTFRCAPIAAFTGHVIMHEAVRHEGPETRCHDRLTACSSMLRRRATVVANVAQSRRSIVNTGSQGQLAYRKAFADLSDVVLEESSVLHVDASLRRLSVTLDLVLTPAHREYSPPRTKRNLLLPARTLTVDSDTAVLVRRSTCLPAIDASGEAHYGHIDSFTLATDVADNVWELNGDWGEALIRQPRVCVHLDTREYD